MTVMAIVAMPALQAMAADDEPKLTVKPTGRVLMDGAVYLPTATDSPTGGSPRHTYGCQGLIRQVVGKIVPGIRSTSSA